MADQAADKMESAAHTAATNAVAATDAAAEDVENIAHAAGQAGVQATKDVSVVIEDVAHDAKVAFSKQRTCTLYRGLCTYPTAGACIPPRRVSQGTSVLWKERGMVLRCSREILYEMSCTPGACPPDHKEASENVMSHVFDGAACYGASGIRFGDALHLTGPGAADSGCSG